MLASETASVGIRNCGDKKSIHVSKDSLVLRFHADALIKLKFRKLISDQESD